MSNRVILYYQTFTGLQNFQQWKKPPITHIHVSSIHFGYDSTNQPYIHLNNYPPSNSKFDTLWKEVEQLSTEGGVKIVLMIGGAGGAFTQWLSNFEVFYDLLQTTLTQYPFIQGINLDVEESIGLSSISIILDRLIKDYPHFEFSMAPISSSLSSNYPGMGGFSYRDIESKYGEHIAYYNGQFYGDYTPESFKRVIDNGYHPSKIVFGLLSGDCCDFQELCKIVQTVRTNYPTMGGVSVWEFCDSPPRLTSYSEIWAYLMTCLLSPHTTISVPSSCNLI